MKKNKSSSRRLARTRAMQAIYQWQHTQQSETALIRQFIEEQDMSEQQMDYFRELVSGIVKNIEKIDESMQPFLDRDINKLNPVELAVLRLAMFELLFQLDVPYRVVINEALEIVKRYGSVDGFKYVNAVLDNAVVTIRPNEK